MSISRVSTNLHTGEGSIPVKMGLLVGSKVRSIASEFFQSRDAKWLGGLLVVSSLWFGNKSPFLAGGGLLMGIACLLYPRKKVMPQPLSCPLPEGDPRFQIAGINDIMDPPSLTPLSNSTSAIDGAQNGGASLHEGPMLTENESYSPGLLHPSGVEASYLPQKSEQEEEDRISTHQLPEPVQSSTNGPTEGTVEEEDGPALDEKFELEFCKNFLEKNLIIINRGVFAEKLDGILGECFHIPTSFVKSNPKALALVESWVQRTVEKNPSIKQLHPDFLWHLSVVAWTLLGNVAADRFYSMKLLVSCLLPSENNEDIVNWTRLYNHLKWLIIKSLDFNLHVISK